VRIRTGYARYLENRPLILLVDSYMGGRKLPIGNYLLNQASNGLHGGVDISYPCIIHFPNGAAGQVSNSDGVGMPINLKHNI
jgi:hypothetical protein